MSTKTDAVQFSRRGSRIAWRCNGCSEPIRASTGYLEVDDNAAYRRHLDHAEQDRQRNWQPVDLGALLAMPGPVPWRAWHRDCDPDTDAAAYWIAIERINTCAKLLHWTGHLWTKKWLRETDWRKLLLRVGVAG